MSTFDVAAEAYDRFMGRYSRLLSPQLADFANISAGQRVLDVRCGPGALTAELVARLGPESVAAVDPSVPFVEAARARHPGVEVRQATSEDLPFADASFDAAIAQLVVHFMSDPVGGLREMGRVTREGGVVAACVWDLAGGRAPVSLLWRAARELGLDVQEDESSRAGARAAPVRRRPPTSSAPRAELQRRVARARHGASAPAERLPFDRMDVRLADPDRDAAAVAAIYRPAIESTIASFEEPPPDADAMARRMRATLARYPWLVANDGETVVGYAYAGPHAERAGYRWSVNVSAYVDAAFHGRGIGRSLYDELLPILRRQGFVNVYAGIALPNPASVALHEAIGMRRIGVYERVGYKLGAWHDVAWYGLRLTDPEGVPPEPTPYAELG